MVANVNTANSVVGPTANIAIASASGNDRKVVASFMQERSGVSVDITPTLNGVDATGLVSGSHISSSGIQFIAMWYWDDSDIPATAGTYEVTNTGLGINCVGIVSADEVAQGAATEYASYNTDGLGTTLNLPTLGGNALVVGAYVRNAGSGGISAGDGQLEVIPSTAIGSARYISTYELNDNDVTYTSTLSQATAMLAAGWDSTGTPTLNISGPDSITDGVATTVTGNELATASTLTAKVEGTLFEVDQSFTLDVDELDFTVNAGLDPVPGTPIPTVPVNENTITLFTGATLDDVILEVDDGEGTATRSVTNTVPDGYDAYKFGDVSSAGLVEGSFLHSDYIDSEDDMILLVQSPVEGVGIVVDANGNWTEADPESVTALEAAGSVDMKIIYQMPSTGESSSMIWTLNDVDFVEPENNVPTGQPTISGSTTQGQTLTASAGTLADADGIASIAYQWQRGGVDISGATSATYTLVLADVGETIRVGAVITDDSANVETVIYSAATSAILPLPVYPSLISNAPIPARGDDKDSAITPWNLSTYIDDAVSFNVIGLPAGISVTDDTDGTFSGTPTGDEHKYVTVIATSSTGHTLTTGFVWVAGAPTGSIVGSGTSKSGTIGSGIIGYR